MQSWQWSMRGRRMRRGGWVAAPMACPAEAGRLSPAPPCPSSLHTPTRSAVGLAAYSHDNWLPEHQMCVQNKWRKCSVLALVKRYCHKTFVLVGSTRHPHLFHTLTKLPGNHLPFPFISSLHCLGFQMLLKRSRTMKCGYSLFKSRGKSRLSINRVNFKNNSHLKVSGNSGKSSVTAKALRTHGLI